VASTAFLGRSPGRVEVGYPLRGRRRRSARDEREDRRELRAAANSASVQCNAALSGMRDHYFSPGFAAMMPVVGVPFTGDGGSGARAT